MTELDFQKKKLFPTENAWKISQKNCFLTFSQDSIIGFFWFFAQRCVLAMSNSWEKLFSSWKCRKSPILQIFIKLFPYIPLFFHTKTLLITMPTIKHVSIVNKTDFCSRNFLKIAGTAEADIHWKNGISFISQDVLDIFSWNFSHWCKMAMPKMWQSPIFEKIIFPVESVFWDLLEISSLKYISN